ncbi:MAG TPA: hypothetical protein VJ578_03110 [Dehalococcoidia bacterium]|nr:hypothetical protein [Dehalococcoidia bacterium]
MRLLPRYAASLAGLALLAVLLAACGGDDEGEPAATSVAPSPTPAPAGSTAEERDAAGPILMAAALVAEDMPEGFTFDEEKFLTNEEAVDEDLDYPGAATLEDYNRWEQILQYEAEYSRETPPSLTGATLSIQVTTVLYRDPAGADESFDFLRQQTSDAEYVEAVERDSAEEGQDIRDLEISPISFAGVGEDRMAFEATFTMYDPDRGQDLDFVSQLIAVRRGRAIGALAVRAVGSPHPLEEVEDLARTLDERMKDALE